jgi:hypothetical protein
MYFLLKMYWKRSSLEGVGAGRGDPTVEQIHHHPGEVEGVSMREEVEPENKSTSS